jgi:hypothetical protein
VYTRYQSSVVLRCKASRYDYTAFSKAEMVVKGLFSRSLMIWACRSFKDKNDSEIAAPGLKDASCLWYKGAD